MGEESPERRRFTRDPFGQEESGLTVQPSQDNKTALPKLIAILWDQDNLIAIFKHDGKLNTVGRGAQVAGVTIVKIEPKQVTIERNGKKYPLRLWMQKGFAPTSKDF